MGKPNTFHLAKESIPGFWHQIPWSGEIPKSVEYHIVTIDIRPMWQLKRIDVAMVKNLRFDEIPPENQKVAWQFVHDAARAYWGNPIAAVFFADEIPGS